MLAQCSAIIGKPIELLVFLNTYLWVLLKKRSRMAHFHSLLKVSYDRRSNGINLKPGNVNLTQEQNFLLQGWSNTGRGCPGVMESPFVEMLTS